MNGTLIVNNLSGLLIVTSLMVIGARRITTAAWLYALQSLVLVLIFLTLAATGGAHDLYLWSLSAFVTKVVLVPLIMYHALSPLESREDLPALVNLPMLAGIAAICVLLSWYAISNVQLALVANLKPALAVSMGHFLLGMVCIMTQRNILKQIFGYCLMENGAHLTLALMASNAHELVEIGIATDAVFGVIVMVILARKIQHTLRTVDAHELTSLKG